MDGQCAGPRCRVVLQGWEDAGCLVRVWLSSRLNHRNQSSVTDVLLFNMLSLCWFLWNKEVTSTFLKILNLPPVTLLMLHAVFHTVSDVSWRTLHLWEYGMGAVPNLGEWLFRKHRACLGFSKGFSKRFNTCFLPLCVFCFLYCLCVFVLLNRKVIERFQQANRIPTWVYLGSDFVCQVPLCLGSCISITTNSSAPCLTAKVCVCPCGLGCLFIQLMHSETFLPPRKGEDAKGSLWGHWMKMSLNEAVGHGEGCHWLSLRWKSV